jgi:hypothetical protein
MKTLANGKKLDAMEKARLLVWIDSNKELIDNAPRIDNILSKIRTDIGLDLHRSEIGYYFQKANIKWSERKIAIVTRAKRASAQQVVKTNNVNVLARIERNERYIALMLSELKDLSEELGRTPKIDIPHMISNLRSTPKS